MEPANAVGIWVDEKLIMVFKDESEFKEALRSNQYLVPLFGGRDVEKEIFPGLYIAKAN